MTDEAKPNEAKKKGMTRQGLIAIVVIAAAVLVGATLSRLTSGPHQGRSRDPSEERRASRAVLDYFGDNLTEGSKLDRWTLVRVFDVHEGAIPVEMATADGKRFKASLFRRDPGGPKGVADTQQLTLYISNQGDGRVSTPEEQGQGLMALAGALTVREAAGAKPPPLSTMKEHRASFPIRDAHGPRGPTDRPRDAGAADGPADR
ncbi:MAG TPA: hypothetical protein VN903_01300 [Polyangia bacterium]|jgi:hypothetical protein|nr:hypothetical protein [Polyangia bacterium]